MADKKLTKVQKFNAIKETLGENMVLTVDGIDFDTSEFLDHEIELVSKKVSPTGKSSNPDDEPIKAEILATLADGNEKTVSEIIRASEKFTEMGATTQKISPRVKSLLADGKIKASESKGKTYYSVV